MNTAEDFIILQGHVYQHNKKKFDNRTLQTREIKKIPLFSEHTSYIILRKKLKGKKNCLNVPVSLAVIFKPETLELLTYLPNLPNYLTCPNNIGYTPIIVTASLHFEYIRWIECKFFSDIIFM